MVENVQREQHPAGPNARREIRNRDANDQEEISTPIHEWPYEYSALSGIASRPPTPGYLNLPMKADYISLSSCFPVRLR